VRDDPVGAESRGINVVRVKMIAFCASCSICGLAGSLYGTFSQLVSPELGLLQQTGLILSMVVIGGMGSLSGAIFGAVLIYLGSEWLRGFGDIQMIVFALLVIVFARYIPGGLWGMMAARMQGRRP
jgi:branched-chain amino acid transport system permease protein